MLTSNCAYRMKHDIAIATYWISEAAPKALGYTAEVKY